MPKRWPNGDPQLKGAARRACLVTVKARGWNCYRCGKPIDYTLTSGPWRWEGDEVTPRWQGGSATNPANVVASHARCNRAAGARITSKLNQKRHARKKNTPTRTLTVDKW